MISGMVVIGETKLFGKPFSSALEIKELESDHLYIQGDRREPDIF